MYTWSEFSQKTTRELRLRPDSTNLNVTKDTMKYKLFCIIQKGNRISSTVKRVNLVSIAVENM